MSVGDALVRPAGDVKGVVLAVRVGKGDTVLDPREVVLSATGADAARIAALAPGDAVTLTSAATPGWEMVTHALGGDRFIVQDGMVRVSAVFGRTIGPAADFVHPRTAVGLRADGSLVMATVDGRQPGYSIGASVYEMGELMRSMGAVTAINLDGGGSTTMVVRPPGDQTLRVANRPADGDERPVTNELVVYSSDPFPPVVSAPVTRLAKDRALLPDGSIPVSVSWSAADPSGVADVTLQRQIDGGGWEELGLLAETDRSVQVALTRGRHYAFRVRATDALGNLGPWTTGAGVVGRVRQQDHGGVTYSGDWATRSDPDASGRSFSSATARGSALTVSFTGESIGWVAPRVEDGGRAEVTIDGGAPTAVELRSDDGADRLIVYRRRLTDGPHVLRLTVTSGPPDIVRVDAFVILAPAP